MFRLFAFIYDLAAYVFFLTVFLLLIAFANQFSDFAMPKTITCKADATMVQPPEKRCTVW